MKSNYRLSINEEEESIKCTLQSPTDYYPESKRVKLLKFKCKYCKKGYELFKDIIDHITININHLHSKLCILQRVYSIHQCYQK
jgi:hypothetical protein